MCSFKRYRVGFILIGLLLFIGCLRKDVRDAPTTFGDAFDFPEVPYDADNAYTSARWELGKKLFFDPILSIDSSLSCAGCHKPSLAFSDSVQFSPGVFDRPGTRNAPSLANVAYHPYFLKEGGVPTLEMQILVPIQEHNEFAHNIVDIAEQLKRQPQYVAMCKAAYDRVPDPFTITRALGVFERSISSSNSAFDRYAKGERSALDKNEIKGMELFFSARTGCTNCHSGFNFTTYAFQNNGQDTTDGDTGRMRFTKDSADAYLFKVPTLRNIGLTAPYMHDGRYSSLEEVVEHYNNGGQKNGYANPLIRPLGLSKKEKEQMVMFLRSLSDAEFVKDIRWQ